MAQGGAPLSAEPGRLTSAAVPAYNNHNYPVQDAVPANKEQQGVKQQVQRYFFMRRDAREVRCTATWPGSSSATCEGSGTAQGRTHKMDGTAW